MKFMEDQTAQKLRGGYYTPVDLAEFLALWIKEINPTRVLEPSCGDGAFLQAISNVGGFDDADVLAFELDESEARKAHQRTRLLGLPKAEVRSADFMEWAVRSMQDSGQPFDAVLGNPPFIRYQFLPAEFQARAEIIFDELDLRFTKHTNAWVPFILASMAMLRPGGRLAMVVPSEIIHVGHAQALRSYLGRECRRLVIVDPEELWFDGTLQGAVILMAEKRHYGVQAVEGMGIHSVRGRDFLKVAPHVIFDAPNPINGKTVAGKWTRALLDVEARLLLDEMEQHPDVKLFDDVARVDVGIVTGANKFFLVDDETVRRYGLERYAHPMFGRSDHCPGLIYNVEQHERNAGSGKPTNFLWFDEPFSKMSAATRRYIALGEKEKLHTRYKCRIRTPWYKVPSVYSTDVGMLKRSHDTPRLILNDAGAYTTDTAYRIRAHEMPASRLVGSFLNPLTALSAELEGRHYGGGVLELVPSEIERLLLPLPADVDLDLAALDRDVRSSPMDAVLERQGKTILGALGISKAKQSATMASWRRLRDRRHRIALDEE